MRVIKKPASCGWLGQKIAVRLSFQAQKPAALPIKLAISVIFQVVMDAPSGLYTAEVLSLFRNLSRFASQVLLRPRSRSLTNGSLPRISTLLPEEPLKLRNEISREDLRQPGNVNPARRVAHFRRMPPITSCMSTPLLLSIQAAMKLPPAQVLPV